MSGKKKHWGLLDGEFHEASLNMAVDEVLFKGAIDKKIKQPMLRIYGFYKKALTFGFGQITKQSKKINSYVKSGHEACRRITGGGIVEHGEDLTYSVISPSDYSDDFRNLLKSYKLIHDSVRRGFEGVGIDLLLQEEGQVDGDDYECFKAPVKNDLMFGKKKIGGAAQKRVGGYFLHQGSISLRHFTRNEDKYFDVFEKAKKALIAGFSESFGLSFVCVDLSLDEMKEAKKLRDEKYASNGWNFKI